MAHELTSRVLHKSGALTIRDVHCRPSCRECGPEEHNDDDSIVFIRSGSFVRRTRGEDAFADSNSVLFFSRDEPYYVYHPVDGGDDCTSLTFSADVLREALSAADRRADGWNARLFDRAEVPLDGPTLACLHKLRHRAKAGVLDALGVEEASLRLLSRVIDLLPPRPRVRKFSGRLSTSRAHASIVLHARAFLAASFRRPLLLGEVAALRILHPITSPESSHEKPVVPFTVTWSDCDSPRLWRHWRKARTISRVWLCTLGFRLMPTFPIHFGTNSVFLHLRFAATPSDKFCEMSKILKAGDQLVV